MAMKQLSPEKYAEAKEKLAKAIKVAEELQTGNKIYFFDRPNPLQAELLEAWENPQYKVFTYTGANQIGKTTIEIIIALSVMFGEWPWSGEKIKFSHNKPRKVRIVGQGWETHIKAVLLPKLLEWWPKNRPVETKKNNQGVDFFWIDKPTKSTLEIMSNSQDSEVHEGWEGDLVGYDEPPKRDIRIAEARGLLARGGRELFCMTLLKEAWIHREVIKARIEKTGEPDMTVKNFNGDISVNVGYGLTQANIDQFAKTLTDDEKQARLYGKPSYMSSLVLPRFDRLQHVKERFKVPLDWLVDIQIDFHPSKKWAVVFLATSRNGFKYVTDEIWDRGNPKYIAEEIVRRCRERDYVRINSIEIDPLAKGGESNEIDVFSIVSGVLASKGYSLGTASKDKEVGISILNNLLWTENEMPGLFFFKDCVKTIEQCENWMYDPETLKPSKEDDDFVECLYRLALKDTYWFEDWEAEGFNKRVVML
jgi:hypothetical protein